MNVDLIELEWLYRLDDPRPDPGSSDADIRSIDEACRIAGVMTFREYSRVLTKIIRCEDLTDDEQSRSVARFRFPTEEDP